MEQKEQRASRLRYAVIGGALWVSACIAAFALSEIALRIFTPFDLVVTGDRIILPANRQLRFENHPDSRSFRSSPWIAAKLDPIIVHNKNSLGFRGAEAPAPFDDHLTIITVGGSTTECFYLSDGKTWPDRLAVNLSTTFSDVWLNNAGLDGHSTYGHTVLLEDHIVPLKPKVVLFLIGINDLHAEQPLDADRRGQRVGLDFTSAKALLMSTANYSQVFAVALNLYRHSRAAVLGFDYNPDFDLATVARRSISESERTQAWQRYDHRLPAFRQRLVNLIAISRRHGIEPVLMTQPVLYGRGMDDMTGVDLGAIAVSDLNGELAWDALEIYNGATREIGDREGVLVIDLANKLAKSSRYYYDFYHYTNEGAGRVADIVYDSLCPFLATKYPGYVRGSCSGAAVKPLHDDARRAPEADRQRVRRAL